MGLKLEITQSLILQKKLDIFREHGLSNTVQCQSDIQSLIVKMKNEVLSIDWTYQFSISIFVVNL